MRHFQERRDNQTGSGLLVWADLQLPVLKSTFCWIARFAPDAIKDWFISFLAFPPERERGRCRYPFLSVFWTLSLFTHAGRNLWWHLIDWLLRAHWPGSSRQIREGESRYSVNARPVLLILFVCVLLLWGCSPAKAMVHCAGCERPILDRFLLNVLDRAWHVKCVQCCECKCNLTEKCFSREGRLYCKNDFFR